MPVEAQDFKNALATFPSGVTVITMDSEEGPHAMTASAFCSLSLDPPLVLVCVKNGNRTYEKLKTLPGFAVNILAEDQADFSNRFAGYGPNAEAPFDGLDLHKCEASGAPGLPGCLATLDCTLYGTRDGGDHTIFIGQVENTRLHEEKSRPLLYARSYFGLGEKF